MSLRQALKDLNGLFKDLSSLHVRTYVGTAQIQLTPADGKNKAQLLDEQIAGLDAASSNVKLVAETYCQFDGDSCNFLTSDDVPSKALELHDAAVVAGRETRQGLMELVKDIFD